MSISSISTVAPTSDLALSYPSRPTATVSTTQAADTSAPTQTSASTVAEAVSALTTLVQQSAQSQELDSISASPGGSAGVQSSLSAAFSKLLSQLAVNKSDAAVSAQASSSILGSLVSNSLNNFQSAPSTTSTLGSIVDTKA